VVGSHARRTIGVFTAQLDEAYQDAIWRGIEGRARALGIGVIGFLGQRVASRVPMEVAANLVYQLADPRNVNGIIVVTTAIATFIGPGAVREFFERRSGMPQVSVGLKVPGIASITVDGTDAVVDLVRHLVRIHGLRTFALIKGPPGHPEAEDRARAFHRVLEEEGIAFDERLAVSGNFVRESGEECARHLVESRVPFEALVCLNDRMALGAMDVLRATGIRVPADVAVVGFDGIEEGRYAAPTLTTIEQPIEELGRSAVDELVALMDGGAPRDRVLSCQPVYRQSCRCPPAAGFDPRRTELPPGASDDERRTVADLVAIAESDESRFLERLGEALAAGPVDDDGMRRWQDDLTVVRHAAAPGRTAPPAIELARVLVGETAGRRQGARRIATEERLALLRSISASLAGAFELPSLLERLDSGLARLDIPSGFLVLLDDADPAHGRARLVMARREGRGEPLPPGGVAFGAAQLLPRTAGSSWRREQWVLEPLSFQDELLGYLLLPGSVGEAAVYQILRDQIASSLKGTLLLEQLQTHERRLEVEVASRTAELTRANEDLTREMERRKHLEREVHEVSNRTMQRIGQDLHDDLCQHLAGIAMLASVVRRGLGEGEAAAAAAMDNITGLLADSIARTRQIARGLYPAGLGEHGLVAAVEELVEAAARKYPVAVTLRAAPDFSLPDPDRALQAYRIVQEALGNALKHSGSDRVEVRLYRDDPPDRGPPPDAAAVVVEVTDRGAGLPDAVREGMGMRIMRYRAETAGAELRIERLDPGTRVVCRIPLPEGED
jgi:DNA-binding LacI/PurR family transcriptional regulator/signal transduction histidine kinase